MELELKGRLQYETVISARYGYLPALIWTLGGPSRRTDLDIDIYDEVFTWMQRPSPSPIQIVTVTCAAFPKRNASIRGTLRLYVHRRGTINFPDDEDMPEQDQWLVDGKGWAVFLHLPHLIKEYVTITVGDVPIVVPTERDMLWEE